MKESEEISDDEKVYCDTCKEQIMVLSESGIAWICPKCEGWHYSSS
jgi:ribosomal protein L37AE/L43A